MNLNHRLCLVLLPKGPKKLCCNGIICLAMNFTSCRFIRTEMRHLWPNILLRLLRMIHWLRFRFKIYKHVRLTLFWSTGIVQFYYLLEVLNFVTAELTTWFFFNSAIQLGLLFALLAHDEPLDAEVVMSELLLIKEAPHHIGQLPLPVELRVGAL